MKGKKISLGGFDTLGEVELRIKELIAEIKVKGLDYVPPPEDGRSSGIAIKRMLNTKLIRQMRTDGYTIATIAKELNISEATVCNKTKDMGIDKRLK